MISTLALSYHARLWNSSYPHPVEWILYLVSVGAQGCHLNLFSAPQWKVSCKWSLLSLSLELQSLSHCGWETVWEWNKKGWTAGASGRYYALWNFMTLLSKRSSWSPVSCFKVLQFDETKTAPGGAPQASLLLNAQPWHGLPFNLNY